MSGCWQNSRRIRVVVQAEHSKRTDVKHRNQLFFYCFTGFWGRVSCHLLLKALLVSINIPGAFCGIVSDLVFSFLCALAILLLLRWLLTHY